jgi:phage anti-repressor protein
VVWLTAKSPEQPETPPGVCQYVLALKRVNCFYKGKCMSFSKEDKLALVKADAIVLFQKFHEDDKPEISLAENWELFGYSRKDNTFAAFEDCGFVEGVDYSLTLRNSTQVINGKEVKGKPIKDYLLTPRTLDHFGMMLRNESGKVIREAYRECRKIVQSYGNQIAQIMDSVSRMADTVNQVQRNYSEIQRSQSETNVILARIVDRLTLVEEKVTPTGISMDDLLVASEDVLSAWETVRNECRMAIPDVSEAEKQARRSFGKMLSTAGRNAGAVVGKQYGVSMYNERKIKEIVEKLAKPIAQYKARASKRIKPAPGQGNLFPEQ